jgi:glycosyltransferase involved in cell wall biosynthesis
MSRIKITIITVVHNGGKTLDQTMHSVFNQTYNNIEYIVIDGASSDNTLDIVKIYDEKIKNGEFSNVTFRWISELDNGIYDAMNKGIDLATGEWINFMNAGDVFCDNFVLNNIANQYLENTRYQFFYSNYYVWDNKHLKKKLYHASYDKGKILHQSVIYKRNLHHIYGYYVVTNEIIVSDYLFFNSINESIIKKTDIPISINEPGGISSGSWCYEQKLCVDYIYRRISLGNLLKNCMILCIKKMIKKMAGEKMIILYRTFRNNFLTK